MSDQTAKSEDHRESDLQENMIASSMVSGAYSAIIKTSLWNQLNTIRPVSAVTAKIEGAKTINMPIYLSCPDLEVERAVLPTMEDLIFRKAMR